MIQDNNDDNNIATDSSEGTAPSLGSDSAANVVATFMDADASEPTATEATEAPPLGRFAELELDAGSDVKVPVKAPSSTPPLEIDGVEGVYKDSAATEPEPTGLAMSALQKAGLDFEEQAGSGFRGHFFLGFRCHDF